jgi:hypothetical protein
MATLAVRLALAALNKALVKSFPNSTQKVSRKRGRVKKRKLCPKKLCQLRGSPQNFGTTWEQTLPNTVQNRGARHRTMLDEPTI